MQLGNMIVMKEEGSDDQRPEISKKMTTLEMRGWNVMNELINFFSSRALIDIPVNEAHKKDPKMQKVNFLIVRVFSCTSQVKWDEYM